jgi:hypothetical protein
MENWGLMTFRTKLLSDQTWAKIRIFWVDLDEIELDILQMRVRLDSIHPDNIVWIINKFLFLDFLGDPRLFIGQ